MESDLCTHSQEAVHSTDSCMQSLVGHTVSNIDMANSTGSTGVAN
jgi:hypothetical protein